MWFLIKPDQKKKRITSMYKELGVTLKKGILKNLKRPLKKY